MSDAVKDRSDEPKDSTVEILTGPNASLALSNTNVVRELIRHHAQFNFAPPAINDTMSRDDVSRILDLYGYPQSILTQEQVTSGILGMIAGFTSRFRKTCSSPSYNAKLFDEEAAADREAFENDGFKQVENLRKEGNMLAAEVDEKVVGMLGMRKLGPVDGSQLPDQIRAFVNGRQLYEHLKASVLPDYEGNGFFRQLKKKAVELNRQESKNPLWVMHSKNPKVLRESEKYERLRITFEDYRRLRAWKMSDAEAEKLKQKWDMEGWEYWIVDFLKEKEA